MDPTPSCTLRFAAPASQFACYSEWLKIEIALRLVLTHSWTPEAWQEVRQNFTWMLAERSRLP